MERLKWKFWFWGGRFRRQFFMAVPENEEDYKKSRNEFIATDAMYQMICNLAGGNYLMSLLAFLGVSDGVIGIVLSLGSLAAVFQLAILKFMQRIEKYKPYVVITVFQRLWLGVLFLIPFIGGSLKVKAVVVIFLFLFGQIWSQTGNTVAISWMALLVPNDSRGAFLARKEAIAVFSAVFSTFCMGIVYDRFAGSDMRYAFGVNGGVLIILALVNTILFICMKDPRLILVDEEGRELHGTLARRARKERRVPQKPIMETLKEAFSTKGFQKVLSMTILWNVCYFTICPFMASYTINDIGLSFTFVTLINLVTTVLRVLILPVMGKFSDRSGAEKAFSVSLAVLMAAYILYAFTVPSNGAVMYFVATLVAAIGWSYIGAGLLNIQLKYLDETKQTEHYTILSAVSGLTAILISIVSGKILDFLQKNRVVLGGRELYAQQILNVVGAIFILILIWYVMFVIRPKKEKL